MSQPLHAQHVGGAHGPALIWHAGLACLAIVVSVCLFNGLNAMHEQRFDFSQS